MIEKGEDFYGQTIHATLSNYLAHCYVYVICILKNITMGPRRCLGLRHRFALISFGNEYQEKCSSIVLYVFTYDR